MMGRPKVRGRTRRLTVELDEDLFNRALDIASRQRKSLREVIEDALRAYLGGKS